MKSISPSSDGQPTRPTLQLISPAVVDALYRVVDGGSDNSVPTSRLRWAAGIICRDAQASGYPVERMLVELKSEWAILLDSLHFPVGAERTEVTNRFIASCIDEYFRVGSTEVDNSHFGLRGTIGPSLNEADRSHRV